MQSHITNPDETYDDEISLADIVAFIVKHLYLIIAFALTGLLLGTGLSWMSLNQWQANADLQVGQIQYAGGGAQPVLIEPVAQTVARVESRSFQDALLKSQNQDPADDTAPLVKLVRKTLTAKAVVGTSLVHLSVRGFTPDQSKALLQASEKMLIAIHAEEADSLLSEFRARLARVDQELTENDVQIKRLNDAIAQRAKAPAAAHGANDALLLGLMSKASQDRQDLMKRKTALEEQLNPNLSFISKPLGDITVSDKPVYPLPVLFAVTGLAIGLLVGLGLGWLRDLRQRGWQT
ncbi:Wzz/FepE/Etk N-terminal domain-containing protein [Pandoraea thiooxydans]|nr:Wzz/FepE/Etk N-terminal domain-containing protein [Pandoraea thiooxydans]